MMTYLNQRPPTNKRSGEDDTDRLEEFEEQALGGVIGLSLAELEAERIKVNGLLDKARSLFDSREESKFEKLARGAEAP